MATVPVDTLDEWAITVKVTGGFDGVGDIMVLERLVIDEFPKELRNPERWHQSH